MTQVLVGTLGARANLAAFSALGLDAHAIAADAGLAPAEIANPDGMIAAERFYAMWASADRRWARPGLGLAAGRQVPFGAYDVLDYVMLSGDTIGAGLADASRYFALTTRTAIYRVEPRPACIRFEMRWQIEPRGVMFHLRDYGLAVVASRVAAACDGRPERVCLSGPSLAPAAMYVDCFGGPVELEATDNALEFSHGVWSREPSHRDATLHRTLERHAAMLLERQPSADDSFEARLQACIRHAVRDGEGSIHDVARKLGMSVRTLQRRLRDGGSSFAARLRDVRDELAIAYLQDRSLSVTEIAYLLGFSETSAFSRAFHSWRGVSPLEYRKQVPRR